MRLRSRHNSSNQTGLPFSTPSVQSPPPQAPSENGHPDQNASRDGSSQDSNGGAPPRTRQEKLLLWGIGVGVVLLIGGLGYWYWSSLWLVTMGRVVVEQAWVTSPLKGRIHSLLVQEGEPVQQGQLLVKLDDQSLQAEIKQAQAVLEQAQSTFRLLPATEVDPGWLNGMAVAQRDVHIAKRRHERTLAVHKKISHQLKDARRKVRQGKELLLLNAISLAQWEQIVLDQNTLQSEFSEAESLVDEEWAAMKGAEEILSLHRQAVANAKFLWREKQNQVRYAVKQAEANLEAAKARVQMLSVYAPRDGIIGWIPKKVGEVVDHDDTILGLLDPTNIWINAYIEGEEIEDVVEGRKTLVKIEGMSDDYYEGKVSLMYAYGNQPDQLFSVGPPRARTPAHISDLMHSVKVIITEDLPAPARAEMIAWVWISRS